MRKKLCFEDATMYYNKWVSGIAQKEMGAQPTTLRDLFGKGKEPQHPNEVKAPKIIPFPLENTIPQLTNLYISVKNLRKLFANGLHNPVLEKNESAKIKINTVLKQLHEMDTKLESMFKLLETL